MLDAEKMHSVPCASLPVYVIKRTKLHPSLEEAKKGKAIVRNKPLCFDEELDSLDWSVGLSLCLGGQTEHKLQLVLILILRRYWGWV